jgi:peptidoglycan/LPS O-acetylase OafA/YrhL
MPIDASSRVVRNLQALRAAAGLLVVGAHLSGPTGFETKHLGSFNLLGNYHSVGSTGVDLFFIISGFIMIVTTHRVVRGPETAKRFLLRRIARIYPPYFVVTAGILVLFLLRPDLVNSSQTRPPDILSSFLLLPQAGLPLLLVSWTLVFEVYFYIALAISLLVPRRVQPVILAGWGVAVVGLGFIQSDNPFIHLVQSPLNFEFLFGALIGVLTTTGRIHRPLACAIGGGAIVLGIYTLIWTHVLVFESTLPRVFTVGIALTVLVYGMVGLERRGIWVVPRFAAQLGDYSYSLYLTHVLTLGALGLLVDRVLPINPVDDVVGLVTALGASMGVAVLFYNVVEKPLVRLLYTRFAAPSKPPRHRVETGTPPTRRLAPLGRAIHSYSLPPAPPELADHDGYRAEDEPGYAALTPNSRPSTYVTAAAP